MTKQFLIEFNLFAAYCMEQSMPVCYFDFYGAGAAVESDEEEFRKSIEHDFSYFLSAETDPSFRVTYVKAKPDYDSLPEMTCSLATPRNICFNNGHRTFIDYFGQALNIYDRRSNVSHIVTEDVDLAHEIAYLTILSRLSEALERKRLHRIHGLGVESGGRGAIILLPSGGGKSTMALSILSKNNQLRLISEDSPLLSKDGYLLPFPLRIGVHPQNVPLDIDPRYTRLDRRIEFSPKISIDIRCFAEHVSRRAVPATFLLLGVRTTGSTAQITPAPKRAFLRHVLANSIIGIGLYQGLEYLFQKNLRESLQHLGLLLSRVYNNGVLLRRTRVYRFYIGRDVNRNYECLNDFLAQKE
jgi:hypothetical protein